MPAEMMHNTCPNCRHEELESFFSIKNAPVQSLVTIKNKQDALAIPRKDITLTLCKNCGFIFNGLFDTSIDYYTKGYEDQQAFSSTFISFLTSVTKKFIKKYDIFNKEVVEIGCGKGDFINLLSQLGNNRGTGIDPAWEPGRTKDNPNVRFIKEFYSEAHGDLHADAICCRHTLEHIHDTLGFLRKVRASIKEDKKAVLFFEVPSILRILDVQAFWDIFYEHCTYFSPGSLGRLFRLSGFEVLDMYFEYDEQYLFIEAKPTKSTSTFVHPLEESVEHLSYVAQSFVGKVNIVLSEWRDRLLLWREERKKVVVWGGGSKSVGFLTQFADLGVIEHVVDINPNMTGNYIPGIGIQYKNPVFLAEYQPDVVIIMNAVYVNEISAMLTQYGVTPMIVAL